MLPRNPPCSIFQDPATSHCGQHRTFCTLPGPLLPSSEYDRFPRHPFDYWRHLTDILRCCYSSSFCDLVLAVFPGTLPAPSSKTLPPPTAAPGGRRPSSPSTTRAPGRPGASRSSCCASSVLTARCERCFCWVGGQRYSIMFGVTVQHAVFVVLSGGPSPLLPAHEAAQGLCFSFAIALLPGCHSVWLCWGGLYLSFSAYVSPSIHP